MPIDGIDPLLDRQSLPVIREVKPGMWIGPHGRFLKGNAPGPGRPKGLKDATKAYLKSAPRLARAYIKTACKGNALLLKDAREWIMPVDGDESAHQSSRIMIFIGEGSLPRMIDAPLPMVDSPVSEEQVSPLQS